MFSSKTRTEKALFATGLLMAIALLLPLVLNISREPTFTFHQAVFSCVLFACIPVTLITEAVLRLTRRGDSSFPIWVVRPSVEGRHQVEGGDDRVIHDVMARLKEFGYDVEKPEVAENILAIRFAKPKRTRAENFAEHGTFGTIEIKHTASGLELEGRLTFDDILLVETGELTLLRKLLAYLLEGGPMPDLRSSSFTGQCGFIVALFGSSFWVVSSITEPAVADYVYSINLAAAPLLAYGAVSIALNRKRAYGIDHALLGLVLCAIPFIALL